MKLSAFNNLMDLIESVRKLDDLINIHRNADSSGFMTGQYEAKKTKLMGELIDELASPPNQSNDSYFLIKLILDKYYPASQGTGSFTDNDLGKLAAAI